MANKIKVSAPGKIILSGEHAVVYGYPAILSAIDRRLSVEIEETGSGLDIQPIEGKTLVEYAVEVIKAKLNTSELKNLKIRINSQIPIGCGMGSSAALAVAVTAAIFKFFQKPWNLEEINQTAYEIEKKQHGNPSGGDNTISTYGGFLWFRKEAEGLKTFCSLKVQDFPQLFFINTGKPRETTKEMVDRVKNTYLNNPIKTEKIFLGIEKISRNFLKLLLKEKTGEISDLLRENEELLEKLGVVSSSTKTIIRKIEKIGGAAKISGAGGVKGGSGIILIYHANPEAFFSFVKKEKLEAVKIKLGNEGVKNETNF